MEREHGQQERLHALNQPTSQEVKDKKDRKISSTHNAAMTYGFKVDARDKRIQELKLLMELEMNDERKALRLKTLVDYLDSAPPDCITIYTSGTYFKSVSILQFSCVINAILHFNLILIISNR